jgi:glutathione S-transferase
LDRKNANRNYNKMKLFASLTSPYARKVRVMLAEKRIDYDLVPTDVNDPNADLLKYNPLGKVPCLLLDDGTPIFDSPVIMEYLDSVTPVGRLIPEPTRQRVQVRRWEALADGILDAAVSIVIEKRRPEGHQSAEWMARQRGKVDRALKAMSMDLGEDPYCMGPSFTLADVVTGCSLMYLEFRFPEIDWRGDYSNLNKLADKLMKRKSFHDTVPPKA